jgi:hypothetical protein
MTIPSQFYSVFFLIGLAVIVAYAYRQFDKPSFPSQATIPRTMEPLRYLFLKSAYGRARFTYILVVVLFYCLLVWPGKQIVPYFPKFDGSQDLPPAGWALIVALIIAGFVPNADWKPLTVVEETLRRWVHAWFLVPDGVLNTIAVLEDTGYEPPRSQLDAIPNPALRDKLSKDLKLPVGTLEYRWARASMLMASLQQMGSGAAHPLKKAAFDPFQRDFDEIRMNYKALALDIEEFDKESASAEAEEAKDNLIQRVEGLLQRIYAYISWGIRYQAKSESDVDKTLLDLGFRVPPTGSKLLFDIVALPVIIVAGITAVFWVFFFLVLTPLPTAEMDATALPKEIILAVLSGIAAAFMYGGAIFIALKQRGKQIDQGVWLEGSSICLAPIVLWAGLASWGVIAFTTFVTPLIMVPDTIAGLSQDWVLFPKYLLSAVPWFLAGATVSVLLAITVGRNITHQAMADKSRNMIWLGLALGAAAAIAQLIQSSLTTVLIGGQFSLLIVPIVGAVGIACGAIIGFMVPTKCRANLITPPNRIMAQALQDLRSRADQTLGKTTADVWIFEARPELGGITPAEAVQYKGRATSAWRLLDSASSSSGDDVRHAAADRPAPVVIEGGRAGAQRTG